MNFINIGDGNSRHQAATLRTRRHEIHLFEQFFEE
jgi:hypothetical protein